MNLSNNLRDSLLTNQCTQILEHITDNYYLLHTYNTNTYILMPILLCKSLVFVFILLFDLKIIINKRGATRLIFIIVFFIIIFPSNKHQRDIENECCSTKYSEDRKLYCSVMVVNEAKAILLMGGESVI